MSEGDDQFDLTREPESGGQLLSFGAGRARRRSRPQDPGSPPKAPTTTPNSASNPDSYGLPNQERWVDRVRTASPPLSSNGLKFNESQNAGQGGVAAIRSPLSHIHPSARRPRIRIPELPLPAIGLPRPGRRLAIAAAVVVFAAAAVVGVVGTSTGSHPRAKAAAASLGNPALPLGVGADPRATEHPVFLPPVSRDIGQLGQAVRFAMALIARPRDHHHAPTPDATASIAASSTDQPAETDTTPESTYTAPTTTSAPVETTPAPTETTPSPSTGNSGGSSGGGSSFRSATNKTPDYGPTGALGPGSSPNG